MTVFKIPRGLRAAESELQMSPESLSAGRNNNEWKNRKKNMTFGARALLARQANAAEPKQRED